MQFSLKVVLKPICYLFEQITTIILGTITRLQYKYSDQEVILFLFHITLTKPFYIRLQERNFCSTLEFLGKPQDLSLSAIKLQTFTSTNEFENHSFQIDRIPIIKHNQHSKIHLTCVNDVGECRQRSSAGKRLCCARQIDFYYNKIPFAKIATFNKIPRRVCNLFESK